MSEDFMEEFAALDEFYPGSKRKRRDVPPPEVVPDFLWDSRPYKKNLNGVEIQLFTIGALAGALGRPVITIRKWMREGNIPQSPYRLPTKKDKNGEDHKGRRLYTRSMIEAAIDIFTRNGLMEKSRIEWEQHRLVRTELDEAWQKLLRISTTN
jgi:hypothetical protein